MPASIECALELGALFSGAGVTVGLVSHSDDLEIRSPLAGVCVLRPGDGEWLVDQGDDALIPVPVADSDSPSALALVVAERFARTHISQIGLRDSTSEPQWSALARMRNVIGSVIRSAEKSEESRLLARARATDDRVHDLVDEVERGR